MAADQDQKDYQDYLEYQKYMDSQTPQQPDSGNQGGLAGYLSKGLSLPKAIEGGLIRGGTLGNYDPSQSKYGQLYKQGQEDWPKVSQVARLAGGIGTGGALGELAAGGTLAGKGISALLSRIGANTGAAAGLGYLKKPEEGETRGENAMVDAALGGGLSVAGEGLVSAGRGVADKLMKVATGIRKAPEGVGNTLVDQGLWGTKGMLSNQADAGLASQEENLQGLVGQLEGTGDPAEFAAAIAQRGKKFVSPGGLTLKSVEPDLNKVREAADQFTTMPNALDPEDLLALKRQGDWAGYTASGNPAAATDSEIGRTVADKAREVLSGMSDGLTADTLKNEQALILAKKALSRDPTTHQGVGSALFFGKAPGSSLLGSVGAQAAQKGVAGLGESLSDPLVLQSLFGAEAVRK